MATVSQQNIDKNYDKIVVQLTKEDYLPEVEKALKTLSKTANIQGFRKGMVPTGHIKKLYGQNVFVDEVLKSADAQLSKYIIDNKIEILARPLPAQNQDSLHFDINHPTDFQLEFEIGLRPQFEIPLITSQQTVPFYKVTITDDMVNFEVEELRFKHGEIQTIDKVENENNVLSIDLNVEHEEKPIKRSFLLKYFSSEAQNLLMGKKENDNITLPLNQLFNDNFKNQILKDLHLHAHEEKNATLTIEKIEQIESAELKEEFFNKIFPGQEIDTEEKFKEKIKTEISNHWQKESRIYLHNELFDKLIHDTNIELPQTFLKRWLSISGEENKPMELVEKEYPTYEKQIKWQLITEKIIHDHKVEVRNEEMEMAAKMQVINYFAQYGQTPSVDEEWIDEFAKKQLGDKKFSEQLYHQILTDKIFYTIDNLINLQETEINREDFIKAAQEQSKHDHHDHDHHDHDHGHHH